MKQDVILIFFPNKQMILESWKKMLFFLLYNISHCFPFQTMSLDKANWTLAREAGRLIANRPFSPFSSASNLPSHPQLDGGSLSNLALMETTCLAFPSSLAPPLLDYTDSLHSTHTPAKLCSCCLSHCSSPQCSRLSLGIQQPIRS